jgi:hypothetical protein
VSRPVKKDVDKVACELDAAALSAGTGGLQHAVAGEDGEAVGQRPADHGELARAGAGVLAGCRGSGDGRVEHADGVLLGMPQFRVVGMQLAGTEHQVEQRGIGQRERDVGVSHRYQRRRNLPQVAGELVEALGGDGRQRRGPVAEVILRRGVRHAGAPGDGAQADAVSAPPPSTPATSPATSPPTPPATGASSTAPPCATSR